MFDEIKMTDYTFMPSFHFSLINNNEKTIETMRKNDLLVGEADGENPTINVNNLANFFNIALKIQTKTNGKETYIKSNFRKCKELDFLKL